jgi:uncharacterized protein YyaL (SSP411 family)
LNAEFISIKVDREEHPDVDAIYMEAVQSMTGSGGWPMTVFCDSKRRPFFGGTYFPKVANHGMPAFTSLLEAVATAWSERRDELSRQSDELISEIETRLAPPKGVATVPSATVLVRGAVERFGEIFDPEHGGVGRAPKFPQAPMLELMLRADQMGFAGTREMVETTLAAMASGGIYDHLGGGFARYSVDATWTIPHFEKMLYDQASLARLYLHAFQATGDPRVAPGRHRDDCTTCFATSACQEAASPQQRTPTPKARRAASTSGPGGAHPRARRGGLRRRRRGGLSLVRHPQGAELRARDLGARARDPRRPDPTAGDRGGAAILFRARATRVRPALDDKVLTEWNAMMISVLAEAGGALGEDRFVEQAVILGEFLLSSLRRADGRWLRSYQGGRADHLAVATDYAWLTDCFTRLNEATGEARWLLAASECAEGLISYFSAPDGGFFLSGADAMGLPVRPRDSFDGVLPGAVSIATGSLVRLGALLADPVLTSRAEFAVESSATALERAPLALSHLIGSAVQLEFGALELVVGAGQAGLLADLRTRYLPDAVVAAGERTSSELWEGKEDGFAYVCRGGVCLAPVADLGALEVSLDHALAGIR